MSEYVVKSRETIGDVVLNSTGSFSNLDAILSANGFTDWTPDLYPGQVIVIPDAVNTDPNAKRQLSFYPACNGSVNDVRSKIAAIWATLTNNWILATGTWNDAALWIDTKNWID